MVHTATYSQNSHRTALLMGRLTRGGEPSCSGTVQNNRARCETRHSCLTARDTLMARRSWQVVHGECPEELIEYDTEGCFLWTERTWQLSFRFQNVTACCFNSPLCPSAKKASPKSCSRLSRLQGYPQHLHGHEDAFCTSPNNSICQASHEKRTCIRAELIR